MACLLIKTVPSQEEIDAFKHALDNCYFDTCDADALLSLAKNVGHEHIETLDKQLSTLVAEPGTLDKPGMVLCIDSLGALEK